MKFNPLVPEITVSNFNQSLKFYTEILGFKLEYSREGFAFLSREESQLMLQAEENDNWKTSTFEYPLGRGINFEIQVAQLEPLLNNLEKLRYPLFRKPEEKWRTIEGGKISGSREFLIQDPDGYLLRFTQDLGIKN